MVLVMKLSAFCWNVADGQLPDNVLSDFQRDRMLKELPGILDFAGYVLFFPSLLVGPAFDYAEYRRYIDTTMFDIPAQVDPSKRPPVRKKRRIPRSGTPAAWKAASGALWLIFFLYLSPLYDYTGLATDAYMGFGLLRRVWILYMVGVTARCKYYGVWSLTEGACILAGLGYNGVDPVTGKVSWDRLQNIKPLGVEMAQNSRAYLGNWNINTNNWLRNYVYLRVTPKGKKPGFRASMMTFVTSALWHGFYPGYYLTFILAGFFQTVAKSKPASVLRMADVGHQYWADKGTTDFRRHLRPFFLDAVTGQPTKKKVYYDVFSYLSTQLGFSFATAPFLILTFSGSVQAWSRVYFYAIFGTGAAMAFFASPQGKAILKKRLEDRQARSGVKLARTPSQDSIASREPIMGLSSDPQQDIDDVVAELRAEVAARQRKTPSH